MKRLFLIAFCSLGFGACQHVVDPVESPSDAADLRRGRNDPPRVISIIDLGAPGRSSSTDINDRGEVIGCSQQGANDPVSFIWTSQEGLQSIG